MASVAPILHQSFCQPDPEAKALVPRPEIPVFAPSWREEHAAHLDVTTRTYLARPTIWSDLSRAFGGPDLYDKISLILMLMIPPYLFLSALMLGDYLLRAGVRALQKTNQHYNAPHLASYAQKLVAYQDGVASWPERCKTWRRNNTRALQAAKWQRQQAVKSANAPLAAQDMGQTQSRTLVLHD